MGTTWRAWSSASTNCMYGSVMRTETAENTRGGDFKSCFSLFQYSPVLICNIFSVVKHQIMKSLCCPALDYLQQTWPGCGGGSVSTDCVFPHWRYLDRLQGLSCTQKSSAQTQHVVLQVMIQHKWDPSARLMLPDCLSLCVDLHVQSSHRDPLWARKMIFARFWMLLSFWEADAVHSQFPQRQS